MPVETRIPRTQRHFILIMPRKTAQTQTQVMIEFGFFTPGTKRSREITDNEERANAALKAEEKRKEEERQRGEERHKEQRRLERIQEEKRLKRRFAQRRHKWSVLPVRPVSKCAIFNGLYHVNRISEEVCIHRMESIRPSVTPSLGTLSWTRNEFITASSSVLVKLYWKILWTSWNQRVFAEQVLWNTTVLVLLSTNNVIVYCDTSAK